MQRRLTIAAILLCPVLLVVWALWWPDSGPGVFAQVLLLCVGVPVFLVVLPIVLLVAGPPAIRDWIVYVTRNRRTRRGQCPTCGYDRRGIAIAAPCPECGAT